MGHAARLLSWWLVALASVGCSLPTSVTPTIDVGSGAMDAFVIGTDVGPRADAAIDAFVAIDDTGVDAFVPPVDVGSDAYVPPPDAYVAPDAWAGDASTPCERSYGAVPGYAACSGTSTTTCVFYANWPGGGSNSCASVCGARCVSAIGNVDGTRCSTSGSSFPCSQTFQDAICTCTP